MKNLKNKIVLGAFGGMMMFSAIAGAVAVSGNDSVTTVARKVNEYEGQHRVVAKVNEYEGQHRVVAMTRKVNEYEGQH